MQSLSVDRPLSLFGGIEPIVGSFLGVSSSRHWSAALKLHGRAPVNFDGPAFVAATFSRLSDNWHRCLAARDRSPSLENWRWFAPKTALSLNNTSPEVTLERAAVAAALLQGRRDWSNQVPIASGIIAGVGDRRRAIDFVHRRGDRAFDFVELKVGSDNPLFAAIEILQYGLIWLLSRQERQALGYSGRELIEADDIRLSVLAPPAFYRNLDLRWFENGLSKGLSILGERNGPVKLSFAFEAFPDWFYWPGTDAAMLPDALDSRVQR